MAYFNNADFGIQNPFSSEVPDLTQVEIDGDADVGSTFIFGTPADGTRIFDVQNTFTFGDTVSFARGKHSLRVGGELRRHQLNGALRGDAEPQAQSRKLVRLSDGGLQKSGGQKPRAAD